MRAIKTILFHLLRTFRGLVLTCFKFLGGIFIFGFIAMLIFGSEMRFMPKLMSFTFGVGFSVLAWYYDVLLLKLKPDNVDFVLLQ